MVLKNNKLKKIVLEKYDCKCAYCGASLDYKTLQVDHIKPKRRHIKGYYGTDDIENLNPCCKSCNSSKSSFDLEVWRKEIQFKKDRIFRDSSTFRLLIKFNLVKYTDKKVLFYFETL